MQKSWGKSAYCKAMIHKTVLLHEAIDGLDFHEGDVFIDGTLGGGGHTEEVVRRWGDKVKIVAIDADREALERATERLTPRIASSQATVTFIQGNFRHIDTILAEAHIEHADKILLDIGLSSNQFEDSGRGFSFQRDEPLNMSFKKDVAEEDLTAREIINDWDEENIRAILEGYGEEKFAYKIAKAIISHRKKKPIETTFELVDIIKSATPKFYHHRKIHPATKTFQALRITVNDEIEALKEGIRKSFDTLAPHGRVAVISFHSLEDRVVKQFFKHMEDEEKGKRITKKPIRPSDEETSENPRARSAKLRILTRT